MTKIKNIKDNPELKEEQELEELAEKLPILAALFDVDRRKPGALIKKLRDRYPFNKLKSKHIKDIRIK